MPGMLLNASSLFMLGGIAPWFWGRGLLSIGRQEISDSGAGTSLNWKEGGLWFCERRLFKLGGRRPLILGAGGLWFWGQETLQIRRQDVSDFLGEESFQIGRQEFSDFGWQEIFQVWRQQISDFQEQTFQVYRKDVSDFRGRKFLSMWKSEKAALSTSIIVQYHIYLVLSRK